MQIRNIIYLVPFLLLSCNTKQESSGLTLWYKQPAKEWNEALPVGNGRLGAMVFGLTDTECIQLNEESLWAGSQINNNNPNALKQLPEIQRLILDNQLKEAVRLAEKKETGVMVSIKRVSNSPYQIEFGKVPLHEVAVSAKPMPLEYFNAEGNHVSPLFIDYIKPLAGKLPEFVRLEENFKRIN